MKKRIQLSNGKIIELTVLYKIGSNEHWNRHVRGYYYGIMPIEEETVKDGYRFTKTVAHNYRGGLLLPVARRSKKAEEEAFRLLEERFTEQVLEEVYA